MNSSAFLSKDVWSMSQECNQESMFISIHRKVTRMPPGQYVHSHSPEGNRMPPGTYVHSRSPRVDKNATCKVCTFLFTERWQECNQESMYSLFHREVTRVPPGKYVHSHSPRSNKSATRKVCAFPFTER